MTCLNFSCKKCYLIYCFFLLLIATPAWTQSTMDMSESLLKLQQPVMIYDIGAAGFGVYDIGDQKMKFFDWEFKHYRQFPLPKGAGPGEVKNIVLSACLINNKIYILGLFEKKIIVINSEGNLEKEIPSPFIPKKIIYRNNKLYAFKISLNMMEESFPLGAVLDPQTGKTIEEISIKGKLITKKLGQLEREMIGLSTSIDVSDRGNIFLMMSAATLLGVCSANGQILYTVDLPYKERRDVQTLKEGDKEETVVSDLDWYPDMRVFNDNAYICFLKTVSKEKSGKARYQTVIIRVNNEKKMKEKTLDGNLIIIGKHDNQLQVFETDEYKTVSIDINAWD